MNPSPVASRVFPNQVIKVRKQKSKADRRKKTNKGLKDSIKLIFMSCSSKGIEEILNQDDLVFIDIQVKYLDRRQGFDVVVFCC
jgi:hypothetical protein